MSSQNYFDLLGDDENEEPTAVIARATVPLLAEKTSTAKKLQLSAAAPALARPPTKPPAPPFGAVKASEGGRGGRGAVRGGRNGRGYGDRDREGGYRDADLVRETRDVLSRERGSSADDRGFINNDGHRGNRESGYAGEGAVAGFVGITGGYVIDSAPRGEAESWTSDGSRGRGSRSVARGRDRSSGVDGEERPRRREFDRRSGSGFGNEVKRDGFGRGNWGSEGDQDLPQGLLEVSKDVVDKTVEEESMADSSINGGGAVALEDRVERAGMEEDKELTLDEYEKILEEKRRVLLSSKGEERKVQVDKAFESMQLVDKRNDENVFIKLGSDKEKKKKEKEALEKEEKARKTQNINEFLKPADGEKFYGSAGNRGRGRGRGRGMDGDRSNGLAGRINLPGFNNNTRRVSAPRIEDPGQFPTLGAK